MARQVTVCAPGAASSVNVTMFGLIPIEAGAQTTALQCTFPSEEFSSDNLSQGTGKWKTLPFDIPDRCC